MAPWAVTIVVLCLIALTVAIVMVLISFRRVLQRAESVLGIVEREIRPMAAQLGALTEEFRGLSHQVALEVERLGVVTKRVDEITATVAKIVGVLAGLSKIGEIAVIGSGLRRGLGVFVSRLKSRAS
jgi:uncharacterized protein YoxC